ncbi:MAG: hypothetical protein QOE79_2913 [Sphingomonadales bacterium]|nr:hypothetical protein [Sphingomonadales bacterium]
MNFSRTLIVSIFLLLAPAGPGFADSPGRESTLIVYGDDPCPRGADPDEIVVCARRPEEERFRIPSRLRERPDRRPESSWGARVADLEEAQRFTRPNGCSVVGSNGQTGCTQAMIRQWFAERRAAAAQDASIP